MACLLALGLFFALRAAAAPTGSLTQASPGCVSETGTGGICADGKGLDGARSVAVSPDGKSLYAASETSDSIAAFKRNATTGELTQLGGTAGCISEDGTGGACADGRGLDRAFRVAVSADGKSVYVASIESDAVAIFARNTTTGALTQLAGTAGCVSETGTGGECTDGKALDYAFAVTVSADGTSVYVASAFSSAVAVFDRNTTTGALTQLAGSAGCVSETGSGGDCADGTALAFASAVALSPDDKSLYVASHDSNAVAAFARNTTTGELTQLAGTAGCVSEDGTGGSCADGRALIGANSVLVSGDGTSVYAASLDSDAVVAFTRNTTTGEIAQPAGAPGCTSETGNGACADGKGLDGAAEVALSADDKSVYVPSYASAAVSAFARNTTTGELTQLSGTTGCVSESGSGGDCADGVGLLFAVGVAVSPDGKNVYAGAPDSDAVTAFTRDTTTGAISQLTGGCINETGSGGICADGKALSGAFSGAVSPDGKNVYVASLISGVAVLARNTTTGELTQLAGTAGCVSEDGSGGQCADGKGIQFAQSVAVSADGKNVYVASPGGSISDVAVVARNTTTGELTQLAGTAGCVSEDGSGGQCADGKALHGALSVAVSADGTSVYVASASAVAAFARNTTTGELTQLAGTGGCVSEDGSGGACADGRALAGSDSVTVSADGKSVYVASGARFGGNEADAVAVFQRNTTTGELTQLAGTAGCVSETGSGGCADGKALIRPYSVAVSADGKSVYVASQGSDAVAVFQRNTTTGALSQLAGTAGCMSESGTGGSCADGKALDGPNFITVSGDGESVYVSSFYSQAVAGFQRNATTGALTQLAGTSGCASDTGSGGDCLDGKNLNGPNSVGVSADGKHVYVVSYSGGSDGVAVFARTPDLTPPTAPTLTDTNPDSPANDNAPEVKGTAEAGSTVRLYTTSDCSGSAVATGSAAGFASLGLTAGVADNSTTTFRATATDGANNTSACSTSSITYVEAPGFSAAVTLSAAGQPADNPQVALDQNANAVFTWSRRDESGGCFGGCYRAQARARGATGALSAADTLSAAGQGIGGPQVGVDQDGDAVFAWQRSMDTNCPDELGNPTQCVNVQGRARASAGVLSATQVLSPAGQRAQIPQVGIDQDGDAVFTWRRLDGTTDCGGFPCYRVQARARTAAGAFSAVQTLSAVGQNASAPEVAVDPGGDAVFVWERGGRVQARARTAAGVLSATQTLSSAGQPAANPQVAVDQDGDALFTWQRLDGTTDCGGAPGCERVEARRRAANGTLGPVLTLSAAGQHAISPEVAVDPGGDALFVWERGGIVQARARSAAGVLAGTQGLSGAGATNPQVGIDQDGDAVFVWQHPDGTTDCGGFPGFPCYRIQAQTRSSGGGLGTTQTLSGGGQHANGPQVAVSPGGTAVATWWRSDGLNDRVQAATGP
jgi:6-phosphogluconolactonase (cycloisomerase 2 family)